MKPTHVTYEGQAILTTVQALESINIMPLSRINQEQFGQVLRANLEQCKIEMAASKNIH